MKQKKTRKNGLNKFIFRNRHCLAFMTLLLMLAFIMMPFVAYASEGDVSGGTGSYTATSDFRASMGIESGSTPYVDWHEMEAEYELAGGVVANLVNTPAFLSTSSNTMTGRYNDSSPAGNKFITSVTVGNSTVNFPDTAYYFNAYCWNSASSQQFFYNARVSGEGHIAFVSRTDSGTSQGGYVVSDAPFLVGSTRYMEYFGIIRTVYIDEVNTPNNAGFYVYNIYYPATTSVTNLPIYIASSDGASGYTTFTPTESDFSFDNDNFNFNNLLADDLVYNPNPPTPSGGGEYQHNMYLNINEKLMQLGGASYNGKFYPDTDRISIAYNDYIASNLDKYKIKATYSAELVGTAEAPNVIYNDFSFDKYFTATQYIPLTDFVNGTYDVTLGGSLQTRPSSIMPDLTFGVFHDMDDELGQYDFGYYMEFLSNRFGLGMPIGSDYWYYSYWTDNKTYIPASFEWEKHYFDVTLELVYDYQGTSETSVGYYEMEYDILDWNSKNLLNNNLNVNANPETDQNGNPIIVPSNNGSSLAGGSSSGSAGVSASGGSALAYVAPNAVNVTVNPGGSLTPAFQIDDVNIANVAQTMNDVISYFGNDRNENGFWALMGEVYDFLPPAIWGAIATGVSTVLGIAIVKVTLSYFRK